MNTPLIRWLIFLIVGLPFQALVYLIYPFIYLYWRIAIFKKVDKTSPLHWEPDFEVGKKLRWHGHLLDNDDDHGALTQYGFIRPAGMRLLVDSEGNFLRALSDDLEMNRKRVSGDCVAAWAFAYVQMSENDQQAMKADIEKVACNYLKNLGTKSWDEQNNGDVSNRCNNFGINYCPDSDVAKMGQPATGPQFYTNSCLFAIAAQNSMFWKVVFWSHWLLLGGWYWAWWPALYPKDGLWYIRDVTMKMLWVHQQVFGKRWWITMPMKKINESVIVKNELFEAMLGNEPGVMPEIMHAFFSQEKDASSSKKLYENNHRASAYVKNAIWNIYKSTKT